MPFFKPLFRLRFRASARPFSPGVRALSVTLVLALASPFAAADLLIQSGGDPPGSQSFADSSGA